MTGVVVRRSGDRPAAAVTRAWDGQVVVCIASGPSLTQEQVERVRLAHADGKVKTIVINDNYLIAPWADALYAADAKWFEWHTKGLDKAWPWRTFTKEEVRQALAEFKGIKVSIANGGQETKNADVLILENLGPDGLSEKPDGIMTGQNSGYQALNIAVLAGAKKILLLGYDMKFQNGKAHAHNGHPMHMPEDAYKRYARNFDSMKAPLHKLGVDVVNVTPGSRIEAFRRSTLEQELA